MTRGRTRHRGVRAERGAAAVEFALVLVVLLLILLGIIDFGRLLFVSQSVKSASREGARTAVVSNPAGANPGTQSWADITAAVDNAGSAAVGLSGNAGITTTLDVNISDGSVTTFTNATPPVATAPCRLDDAESVTVSTSVTFSWLTPVGALPGLFSSSLQDDRPVGSETTMRCE